ncbi:sigma-70 family RNA polymerase sigma factor [Siminovitchia sp. 179-K 8D1 HS]|uniref:sigma-70 family RNA polymerase sigma factor n=1 Tax=Siminovitchia sp. 179-K 8D1 HS TaxID=3142385 RepID=UPI0039A0BE6C
MKKFNAEAFKNTELEGLTEDEIIEKYFHYIPATINRRFPNNEKFLEFHGLELDDLIQFGRIALMKAIRTFDPNKSNFKTYAINYIYWDINIETNKNSLYSKTNNSFELAEICSLNREFQNENEEGGIELTDLIACERDHIKEKEEDLLIQSLKNYLPKKIYDIIELRVQGYTLQEIGEKYGVTRQYIHSIIKSHENRIRTLIDSLRG